jgi:two-component system chemotaxis response regulator CheY
MKLESVILVDDSSTSRMITKRCLEMAGYTHLEVLEADNGLRALTLLKDRTVDLILTDLNMPKMDGETLIKKVRMLPTQATTPIAIISSIGDESLQNSIEDVNLIGIIQKPISPAKMNKLLEDNDDS